MRALLLLLGLLACRDPGDGSEGGGTRDEDRDGVPVRLDCDDTDPEVNPELPTDGCDGKDNDCDGAVDEDPDLDWFHDRDGDGFGGELAEVGCVPPAGTSAWGGDCDDERAGVYPGAEEHCDGVDEDCDGQVDDGTAAPAWWYADNDGDGAGDPATGVETCEPAPGMVANGDDCDDANPLDPTWVAEDGSATASGQRDDPLGSIQQAIDRGVSCVWVGPGRYEENLDLGTNRLRLRSEAGSSRTKVVGVDDAPNLAITGGQDETTSVEGFTFESGRGYEWGYVTTQGVDRIEVADWLGGGVYVDGASPTLRDVRVAYTFLPGYSAASSETGTLVLEQSHGGAIFVANGTLHVEEVWLSESYAVYGGAVWVEPTGALVGQRLRVEYAYSAQGGALTVGGGLVDLQNVVLNAGHDDLGYGGVLNDGGELRLANATIVDCGIGVAALDPGSITLRNTIVAYNEKYGLHEVFSTETSTWNVTYTDVYGSGQWNYWGVSDRTGRDGNLSVEPLFESFFYDGAGGDDLHLHEDSELIDAGDPDPSWNDADGTRADIGAYGGPGGGW